MTELKINNIFIKKLKKKIKRKKIKIKIPKTKRTKYIFRIKKKKTLITYNSCRAQGYEEKGKITFSCERLKDEITPNNCFIFFLNSKVIFLFCKKQKGRNTLGLGQHFNSFLCGVNQ